MKVRWSRFRGATVVASVATAAAIAAVVPVREARAQSADVPIMNCARATAQSFLDANNVRASLMNGRGLIGSNSVSPAYEVPKGSEINAVRSAGFWLGGVVDGAVRTAVGSGSKWEFWPGPYDAVASGQDCADLGRIYRVEQIDLNTLEAGGEPSRDVLNWPWHLGAPVVDGDGNLDNYDPAAGDRPLLLGDEMHWWVMNDIGNEHRDAPPLGVEVEAMAFSTASNENIHFDNTTFYLFRIKNKSNRTIEDMHFGFFTDVDIGEPWDDYVGSDSVLSLGYTYNADGYDRDGYGISPPAVGVQFIQGPTVNGTSLGLRSFTWFFKGNGLMGKPKAGQDFYNLMTGRWKDGIPITEGGNGRDFSGRVTPFAYSGDPVTKSFWTQFNIDGSGTANNPGDRGTVSSTGPFTLRPEEETDIFVSMITALGWDHLNSVTVLKEAAAYFSGMRPGDVPASLTSGVVPERAPHVLNVDSGATGQPLDLVIQWDASGIEDEGYEVELESNKEQVRRWFVREQRFRPQLDAGATYQIRVRAVSDHAYGPWSEPVTFSTGVASFDVVNPFTEMSVVANASGPLTPPAGAASDWLDFPSPFLLDFRQQAGFFTRWFIHAFLPSNSDGFYVDFLEQVVPSKFNTVTHLIPYDYELRFTAQGSRAWDIGSGSLISVPFELWRTGIGTPDDPSDDLRLIPFVFDRDGDEWGIRCRDHPAFVNRNDPETDSIFWQLPSDESAGDAGYRAWLNQVGASHNRYGSAWQAELMSDMVLVMWDGGHVDNCVFEQNVPEEGTIFRIRTLHPPAPVPGAPAGNTVVEPGPVSFYWSWIRTDSLRVEIARDPKFSQLVQVIEHTESGDTQTELTETGAYWWRVLDSFGSVSEPARFFVGTDGEGDGEGDEPDDVQPNSFALGAPWPNPSAGGVTVPFELPEPARVTLRVYDVLGREVATLLDRDLPAGRHEAVWDAGSAAGAAGSSGHVPGGAYIVRLEAGSFTKSRVVTVL